MPENIVITDGEDLVMARAVERAQETFKLFWRELSWEYRRIIPVFSQSMIKAGFATDSDEPDACNVEHMWVEAIRFDGIKIRGTLLNQPNWIATINQGDQVEIEFDELEDWMLVYENKVYGAFTVHAIRQAMTSSERRQHDNAWGLDFGDPLNPRILFEAPKQNEGFLSRLFSKHESVSVDIENLPEHPMSEQMVPRILDAIKEQPSLVSDVDSNGWTMLHKEALAGNLLLVQTLLEQGADKNLRNPNGHTASDLAKLLGWPNVINELA